MGPAKKRFKKQNFSSGAFVLAGWCLDQQQQQPWAVPDVQRPQPAPYRRLLRQLSRMPVTLTHRLCRAGSNTAAQKEPRVSSGLSA